MLFKEPDRGPVRRDTLLDDVCVTRPDAERVLFEEFKLPPLAPAHDEVFAAWDADASDSLSLDELAKGLAAGKRKS